MNLRLRSFRRPLFAVAVVATLGLGVPAALAFADPPARPRLEPVAATSAADADDGDLRGPCDEAEHAADPACNGTAPTGPTTPTTPTTVDDDEEVRGNCDEAEHAGDPACAGTAPTTPTTIDEDDDDRSGPSSVDDDGDDDRSGPGGEDDDEDRSGLSDDDDRSGSNAGRG